MPPKSVVNATNPTVLDGSFLLTNTDAWTRHDATRYHICCKLYGFEEPSSFLPIWSNILGIWMHVMQRAPHVASMPGSDNRYVFENNTIDTPTKLLRNALDVLRKRVAQHIATNKYTGNDAFMSDLMFDNKRTYTMLRQMLRKADMISTPLHFEAMAWSSEPSKLLSVKKRDKSEQEGNSKPVVYGENFMRVRPYLAKLIDLELFSKENPDAAFIDVTLPENWLTQEKLHVSIALSAGKAAVMVAYAKDSTVSKKNPPLRLKLAPGATFVYPPEVPKQARPNYLRKLEWSAFRLNLDMLTFDPTTGDITSGRIVHRILEVDAFITGRAELSEGEIFEAIWVRSHAGMPKIYIDTLSLQRCALPIESVRVTDTHSKVAATIPELGNMLVLLPEETWEDTLMHNTIKAVAAFSDGEAGDLLVINSDVSVVKGPRLTGANWATSMNKKSNKNRQEASDKGCGKVLFLTRARSSCLDFDASFNPHLFDCLLRQSTQGGENEPNPHLYWVLVQKHMPEQHAAMHGIAKDVGTLLQDPTFAHSLLSLPPNLAKGTKKEGNHYVRTELAMPRNLVLSCHVGSGNLGDRVGEFVEELREDHGDILFVQEVNKKLAEFCHLYAETVRFFLVCMAAHALGHEVVLDPMYRLAHDPIMRTIQDLTKWKGPHMKEVANDLHWRCVHNAQLALMVMYGDLVFYEELVCKGGCWVLPGHVQFATSHGRGCVLVNTNITPDGWTIALVPFEPHMVEKKMPAHLFPNHLALLSFLGIAAMYHGGGRFRSTTSNGQIVTLVDVQNDLKTYAGVGRMAPECRENSRRGYRTIEPTSVEGMLQIDLDTFAERKEKDYQHMYGDIEREVECLQFVFDHHMPQFGGMPLPLPPSMPKKNSKRGDIPPILLDWCTEATLIPQDWETFYLQVDYRQMFFTCSLYVVRTSMGTRTLYDIFEERYVTMVTNLLRARGWGYPYPTRENWLAQYLESQ